MRDAFAPRLVFLFLAAPCCPQSTSFIPFQPCRPPRMPSVISHLFLIVKLLLMTSEWAVGGGEFGFISETEFLGLRGNGGGCRWKRAWLTSPSGWHWTNDQELPGKVKDHKLMSIQDPLPAPCRVLHVHRHMCSSQQTRELTTGFFLFYTGRN